MRYWISNSIWELLFSWLSRTQTLPPLIYAKSFSGLSLIPRHLSPASPNLVSIGTSTPSLNFINPLLYPTQQLSKPSQLLFNGRRLINATYSYSMFAIQESLFWSALTCCQATGYSAMQWKKPARDFHVMGNQSYSAIFETFFIVIPGKYKLAKHTLSCHIQSFATKIHYTLKCNRIIRYRPTKT